MGAELAKGVEGAEGQKVFGRTLTSNNPIS